MINQKVRDISMYQLRIKGFELVEELGNLRELTLNGWSNALETEMPDNEQFLYTLKSIPLPISGLGQTRSRSTVQLLLKKAKPPKV